MTLFALLSKERRLGGLANWWGDSFLERRSCGMIDKAVVSNFRVVLVQLLNSTIFCLSTLFYPTLVSFYFKSFKNIPIWSHCQDHEWTIKSSTVVGQSPDNRTSRVQITFCLNSLLTFTSEANNGRNENWNFSKDFWVQKVQREECQYFISDVDKSSLKWDSKWKKVFPECSSGSVLRIFFCKKEF